MAIAPKVTSEVRLSRPTIQVRPVVIRPVFYLVNPTRNLLGLHRSALSQVAQVRGFQGDGTAGRPIASQVELRKAVRLIRSKIGVLNDGCTDAQACKLSAGMIPVLIRACQEP